MSSVAQCLAIEQVLHMLDGIFSQVIQNIIINASFHNDIPPKSFVREGACF